VSGVDFPEDDTSDHDGHLYTRKEFGAEAGFKEFQENERKLDNQPIRSMSVKTKEILAHIDYELVVNRRRANWQYLHSLFQERNHLSLPGLDSFACPMVYPFMVEEGEELRRKLIEGKIFVAKYWPNVMDDGIHKTEFLLSNQIVAIPCDQRYQEEDMERIVELLEVA
jgi:dTDP-4-amino-4,6-dideoxygalactose transaminase